MDYYDRYSAFRSNGKVGYIPNLKIESASSDLYITYDRNKMRFDSLSYKYYGDANFAWLILMANPQYGSLEFKVPNGVKLRIPYPINSAIARYEKSVSESK